MTLPGADTIKAGDKGDDTFLVCSGREKPSTGLSFLAVVFSSSEDGRDSEVCL